MTIKPEIKLPPNPPGWKGNLYYPSGKVGEGGAYGIVVMPLDKSGKGKVVFPRLAENVGDLLK